MDTNPLPLGEGVLITPTSTESFIESCASYLLEKIVTNIVHHHSLAQAGAGIFVEFDGNEAWQKAGTRVVTWWGDFKEICDI